MWFCNTKGKYFHCRTHRSDPQRQRIGKPPFLGRKKGATLYTYTCTYTYTYMYSYTYTYIYICNIVPSNIILVSLLGTVPRDSWKYVDRTLAFSSCDSTRLRTVFNLCQGRRCGVRICTGAFEFTGDTGGATNHGSC